MRLKQLLKNYCSEMLLLAIFCESLEALDRVVASETCGRLHERRPSIEDSSGATISSACKPGRVQIWPGFPLSQLTSNLVKCVFWMKLGGL
jgi:hypothetical protein